MVGWRLAMCHVAMYAAVLTHQPNRARLFKSPTHVGALNDVLGIYPDASLVWIYRPPVQVGVQYLPRASLHHPCLAYTV